MSSPSLPISAAPALDALVQTATPAVTGVSVRRVRRPKLLLAGGALFVSAGLLGAFFPRPAHRSHTDLRTHTVRYQRLEWNITDRGELESAHNQDIYCRVKAASHNSTIATTIRWVIDEGVAVKKGDLVMELDDSGLQEQLKLQKITLDKAMADKVIAEENFKIVQSQNESDIKTAETTLELARIDLRKYVEGDYPGALEDVEGRTQMARTDFRIQGERLAWALRMLKQGYETMSLAQSEQSRFDSLDLALRKLGEEKRVLTDPTFGLRKRNETDLVEKVAEAVQALQVVRSQGLARETVARSDRALKQYLYWHELTHYREIEAEIKKCRMFAPQAGMVVYCLPEQARVGGGSQQSIIAQGEPVREGQKLMQIPDLRHMVVNAPVHESMVARVHRGQRATVRIGAVPNREFSAHVVDVSPLSYHLNWYSDPVFNTTVAIDDDAGEQLLPGMTAEVTLDAGDTLKKVLAVPVEALVGSLEMGPHRHCYVLTPDGTEERDVIVGWSNMQMAEVQQGLCEGDEVVLNPRELADEPVAARSVEVRNQGQGVFVFSSAFVMK